MSWAAIAAVILKILNTLAPLIALWLARQAGKHEARLEQQAENAKDHEVYAKIAVENRSDGPWLRE